MAGSWLCGSNICSNKSRPEIPWNIVTNHNLQTGCEMLAVKTFQFILPQRNLLLLFLLSKLDILCWSLERNLQSSFLVGLIEHVWQVFRFLSAVIPPITHNNIECSKTMIRGIIDSPRQTNSTMQTRLYKKPYITCTTWNFFSNVTENQQWIPGRRAR